MHARDAAAAAIRQAILVLLVVLTVFPLAFMVLTSFKSTAQYYTKFWAILPRPVHVEYYPHLWTTRMLWRNMTNSLLVSAVSTLGVLALASLAAWAFARVSFRGREVCFALVIVLLMMPGLVTLIPSFLLVTSLGLRDTLWALVLPYTALGQVVAIFMLRTFFATLPEEMMESARMEGAGELRVMYHVGLPLSAPILATVAVLTILSTYNDFIWPLLMLPDMARMTIIPAVRTLASIWDTNAQVGHTMAANVIAAAPLFILFVVGSRYFIRGMLSGALKM